MEVTIYVTYLASKNMIDFIMLYLIRTLITIIFRVYIEIVLKNLN